MLIWPDSDQFISLLHSASVLLTVLIQAFTMYFCVIFTSVSSSYTYSFWHKLPKSHFKTVLKSSIRYAPLPTNARTST